MVFAWVESVTATQATMAVHVIKLPVQLVNTSTLLTALVELLVLLVTISIFIQKVASSANHLAPNVQEHPPTVLAVNQ